MHAMSDTHTIWGLLDQAAQKQPEKGLIFVESGLDEPAITVTYSQLRYEAQVCIMRPTSRCFTPLS